MNKNILKTIGLTFLGSYIVAIPSAFIFGKLLTRLFLGSESQCIGENCLGFAIVSMILYFLAGFLVYSILFFLIIKNKKKEFYEQNIKVSNLALFGWYVLSVVIGFFLLSLVLPIVFSLSR